ncbi:MAG: 1-deoxy-D-xylulose-5-phosphate reductoisomerase [Candidatus Endobugula sp.]
MPSLAGSVFSQASIYKVFLFMTLPSSPLAQPSSAQQITVLGSTGSIGVSTLDVISRHPDRFAVFALTANTNSQRLFQQCVVHRPAFAVMQDPVSAVELSSLLREAKINTEVLSGTQAICDVAAHDDVHTVMAAIVGGAGLLPTMSAVKTGKKVLLANKEALVMAGSLFMQAVSDSGAQLLPIDSEHNAIFQCLPQAPNVQTSVRKILLTGSGGPLRGWSTAAIRSATPEQACAHPNWSMGRKISVDSASLMNKGLEFIEARWLFDVSPSLIEVVIHPQSIIHSMVEYVDGSVLAQLGNPDMRTPIAHGLAYPERIDSGVSSLDIIAAARLDFEAPDNTNFPALQLAIDASKAGIGAATVLNAANEIVVDAFLASRLSFGAMMDSLQRVMSKAVWREPDEIEAVIALDGYARSLTLQQIGNMS